MSQLDQGWSAQELATYRRLSLVTVALAVVAIALPFAIKAADTTMTAPAALATAGLTAWTAWAISQARQSESEQRSRELEQRHMLVWANAVLTCMLAGVTAALISLHPPTNWMLASTAIMTLGWALLHARINQLASRP